MAKQIKILTTTIGSLVKPRYVPVRDWFESERTMGLQKSVYDPKLYLPARKDAVEALVARGIQEVVRLQDEIGLDILTDGEIGREHYMGPQCRAMKGIDFEHLTKKRIRGGAVEGFVPTTRARIRPREHFLARDWRIAQSATKKPVKMTVPGPLSLADWLADEYYRDERRLCEDLAAALNWEILDLAKDGCRIIQLDEPYFARDPEKAVEIGIEMVERCFAGLPPEVERVVHVCCGYPTKVDDADYEKANPSAYWDFAEELDRSSIHTLSIEAGHQPIDLSLLEQFTQTKIILGVVAVAKSEVESVELIRKRLRAALNHIEPERLIAAPDCGLGILGMLGEDGRRIVEEKLANLVQAAHSL